MAILFDITSLLDDQQPAEQPANNVVEFPAKISAERAVRYQQRCVDELEHDLATLDPRSRDEGERVRAAMTPVALERCRGYLRKAEAALALLNDDFALEYRGVRYGDMAGRA